jgi:hypothetical protein
MDFSELLKDVKKELLLDGTYRVLGNLDLSSKRLTSLEGLNVSIVDGWFDCAYNELVSLKGCPKIVNDSFSCSDNELTSLEFAPEIIKNGFYCHINKLTTLDYCPKVIKGSFYCFDNKLISLKGCPKVYGIFWCHFNDSLVSLEHLNVEDLIELWVDNRLNEDFKYKEFLTYEKLRNL